MPDDSAPARDNDIDIDYVAGLARLDLTAEEKAVYGPQLQRVVEHLQQLSELDLSGIEPTAHAVTVRNVMREDASRPGIPREEALGNAPRASDEEFLVPPVLG